MKVALVMLLKAAAIIVIAFRIFQLIHTGLEGNVVQHRDTMIVWLGLSTVTHLYMLFGVTCSVDLRGLLCHCHPMWYGLAVNYGKNLMASFALVFWNITPWYLGFSDMTTKLLFNAHHLSNKSAFVLALGTDYVLLVVQYL